MTTRCRVRTVMPAAGGEAAGTVAFARSEGGDAYTLTTARSDLEVEAVLSRDEAFAFLLAAADALGLVLLDPRKAARHRAASMKRSR